MMILVLTVTIQEGDRRLTAGPAKEQRETITRHAMLTTMRPRATKIASQEMYMASILFVRVNIQGITLMVEITTKNDQRVGDLG
jgi:hypothetical protein